MDGVLLTMGFVRTEKHTSVRDHPDGKQNYGKRDSEMMQSKPQYLVQAALVAALYAGLTLAANLTPFGALQYGMVQLRFSEALTVLPALTPAAIPGLCIGCLLGNLMGMGVWDMVAGSLATILAAWLSRKLRRIPWLVPLPPIVINALVVGSMLYFVGAADAALWLCMLSVAAGEAIVCYGLGMPLTQLLRRVTWGKGL